MVGVDNVDFVSPDYRFTEGYFVLDVIVEIPGNRKEHVNYPVDESCNYKQSALLAMALELVVVSTGEYFYVDHIIDGLIWTFHITIVRRGIPTGIFDGLLILKSELHEIGREYKIYN